MELDDVNARCNQLQQELELKNQYYQGIAQDNKSTITMLQGHVDRLKEMLEQKSSINEQLDSQNT